jgi:tetratricopeptide (TPR) repeat protein
VLTSRRRTAVLSISFAGPPGLRALDIQREYGFQLTLDGREVAAGVFRSPLGDEEWRRAIDKLAEATSAEKAELGDLRWARDAVENAGVLLHRSLRQLSPQLERFLTDRAEPRRLVIRSTCPEIHRLPWEAMLDDTARPWQLPAEADLSIVRATEQFDAEPVMVTAPVTIRGIFGPDTERRTLGAIKELGEKAKKRRTPRIVVQVTGEGSDTDDGGIVNVEAHGDRRTGEADVGSSGFESALGDRLRSRRMVLVWTCHSGFVPSWGESLAMKLHRQDNSLVLAFATPLRFETSAELATGFYGRAFSGPTPVDPETAVVQERGRLYREREPACEWAALMLWLRAPVDLSDVAFDGPRVLPAPEGGSPAAPVLERLARILADQTVPGTPVPVDELSVTGGLPPDLVEAYRGAVVHLRADDPATEMPPALDALAARSPSVHRADRLLTILDRMAVYPDSLLVWSGVSTRELEALRLLHELPRTVSIVLTSATAFASPLSAETAESRGTAAEPARSPTSAEVALTELEAAVEAGLHQRAQELWQGLHDAGQLAQDPGAFLRLQAAGYWALARRGRLQEAEGCVADVKRLDPIEGLLVEGNLAQRRGRYDVARTLYAEASERAADSLTRGRATLERAYLAQGAGNRGVAERLYLQAVRLLEDTVDRPGDARWASALGRALRDYATLLADEADRAEAGRRLLDRALMIHALDGRSNQVGAALRARAKLERARERWDAAEKALLAAASLLKCCGNLAGWADAMVDLAELAADRGNGRQTLTIAAAVGRVLPADQGQRVRGRLALLAAQVAWRLGDVEDALARAGEAAEALAGRPEETLARHLHDVLTSLRAGGQA